MTERVEMGQLAVVQGEPPADAPANGYRDTLGTSAPILLSLLLVLVLGVWIPAPLESLLQRAAAFLEGQA